MTASTYPSIENGLFGAAGDLPALINSAHHDSGFPSTTPPDRKQLNKELNRLDQGMNYLLQGFPEFMVGQSYAIDRLITDGDCIYKSLLTQVAMVGDLADATKWIKLIDLSSPTVVPATSAEAIGKIENSKFITPATLDDVLSDVSSQATTTQFGTTRYATNPETYAESVNDRSLSPANLPTMTASASETQGIAESKKFTTPASAFAGYGFNDPVTKSTSSTLLESEHLILIDQPGITITLPSVVTINKSKLNTVSHRVINISGGNAIIAGGTPSLLPVTKTLDLTSINVASIPTIVGGILV